MRLCVGLSARMFAGVALVSAVTHGATQVICRDFVWLPCLGEPVTSVAVDSDALRDHVRQSVANRAADRRRRAALHRRVPRAASTRSSDPFDEHADPIHVTGSAIVVGRRGVVLLTHKRLGIWLQPGGHVDAGEAPWDGGAARGPRGDRARRRLRRRRAAARARRRPSRRHVVTRTSTCATCRRRRRRPAARPRARARRSAGSTGTRRSSAPATSASSRLLRALSRDRPQTSDVLTAIGRRCRRRQRADRLAEVDHADEAVAAGRTRTARAPVASRSVAASTSTWRSPRPSPRAAPSGSRRPPRTRFSLVRASGCRAGALATASTFGVRPYLVQRLGALDLVAEVALVHVVDERLAESQPGVAGERGEPPRPGVLVVGRPASRARTAGRWSRPGRSARGRPACSCGVTGRDRRRRRTCCSRTRGWSD